MILGFLAVLAGLENFINAPLENKILSAIGIEYKYKYKFIFMVGIPAFLIVAITRSYVTKVDEAENENGDDEAKNE